MLLSISMTVLIGCTSNESESIYFSNNSTNVDQFVKVDCLLPGSVRRLGTKATYLSKRRLIQTTALDCGIRGGEYTIYDRSNLSESLNVWLAEAQTGDAQAQYYVGEIYENGVSGVPDYQNALAWYQKAAKQGHSQAKVNLGTFYEAGLGVRQDKAKALNYYRSAADLTDDQLEYLSTVEKEVEARLAPYKQQLEKEKAATLRKESELNALRNQLAKSRSDLHRAQQRALQQNVVYVDVPSPALQTSDNSTVALELKEQLNKVDQLETQLENKSKELESLRQNTRSQQEASSLNLTDSLADNQALQALLLQKQEELRIANNRLNQVQAEYEVEKQQLQNKVNNLNSSEVTTTVLADQLLEQKLQNDELSKQLDVLRQQESLYVDEINELSSRIATYQSSNESDVINKKVDESRVNNLRLELDQTRALLDSMNERYLVMSERNQYLEESLKNEISRSDQAGQELIELQDILENKTSKLEDNQEEIAVLKASISSTQAEIEGISLVSTEATMRSISQPVVPSQADFGNFHALIIGNNNYQSLPNLRTPETDAKALSNVLKHQYGYQTTLLLNAGRTEIMSKLNEMREKLGEDDNLLVYYAGHGEIRDSRGYWLPVDAENNNITNWISTQQVTDLIATSSIRKVMVVADSCYSGILTRNAILTPGVGATGDTEKYNKWLSVMAKGKSRTVMSSGGLQPVLDSGGGKHSIFAKHFIGILNVNDGVLDANTFYNQLFPKVKKDSALLDADQSPLYAPIKSSNHQSVDYFFVKI
ncbi:caspase family protein [Photobacterium sanctipauli]|nr:caspase family protein [Photobacterium sanctipauli]